MPIGEPPILDPSPTCYVKTVAGGATRRRPIKRVAYATAGIPVEAAERRIERMIFAGTSRWWFAGDLGRPAPKVTPKFHG